MNRTALDAGAEVGAQGTQAAATHAPPSLAAHQAWAAGPSTTPSQSSSSPLQLSGTALHRQMGTGTPGQGPHCQPAGHTPPSLQTVVQTLRPASLDGSTGKQSRSSHSEFFLQSVPRSDATTHRSPDSHTRLPKQVPPQQGIPALPQPASAGGGVPASRRAATAQVLSRHTSASWHCSRSQHSRPTSPHGLLQPCVATTAAARAAAAHTLDLSNAEGTFISGNTPLQLRNRASLHSLSGTARSCRSRGLRTRHRPHSGSSWCCIGCCCSTPPRCNRNRCDSTRSTRGRLRSNRRHSRHRSSRSASRCRSPRNTAATGRRTPCRWCKDRSCTVPARSTAQPGNHRCPCSS